MDKVWKRVALHGNKKHSTTASATTAQSEVTSVQTQTERRPLEKKTPTSSKVEMVGHDRLHDLLWCDLVNMDDWQTVPPVEEEGGVGGGDSIRTGGGGELHEQLDGQQVAPASSASSTSAHSKTTKPARCRGGGRPRRSKGFSFHLDTHIMEFNPRALTRRLCKGSKKEDNELYRSNSFKFERFERPDEIAVQKQVPLCEDYCLPVDFVNKRAYCSGANLVSWSTPSPGCPKNIFEGYSDPKDSKAYLEPGAEVNNKVYTSPDQEYCRPCPSPPPQEKQERREEGRNKESCCERHQGHRHHHHHKRSPYYYSDLKSKQQQQQQQQQKQRGEETVKEPRSKHHHHHRRVHQTASLDSPHRQHPHRCKHHRNKDNPPPPPPPKSKSVVCEGITATWCYDADIESPVSELLPLNKKQQYQHRTNNNNNKAVCSPDGNVESKMPCNAVGVAVASGGGGSTVNSPVLLQQSQQHFRGSLRTIASCTSCHRGHFEEDDDDEEDSDQEINPDGDMSGRQRRVYETAFDSRVERSDDDLDEMDRVSNHPVLRMFNRAKGQTPRMSTKVAEVKVVNKVKEPRMAVPEDFDDDLDEEGSTTSVAQERPPPPMSAIPGRLTSEMGALRLSNTPPPNTTAGIAPSPPPLRGFAPSPPSTAPLPAKFHNNTPINSIQSAPNLPAGSPARLKDLRLPVKSLRARGEESRNKVREIKGRPTILGSGVPGVASGSQRPKYFSTESMATSSSSMSSLESLRSSTSEGNRSSSSSGSRRSDSLSSHSSDSGGDLRRIVPPTRCAPLGLLSNKLHILSPISDKSQEPGSETSDNIRNNNSQKASPEDAPNISGQASPSVVADTELPWDAPKLRRRQLQNKNLINLQLGHSSNAEADTLQNSDSGISIESQGRVLADQLPFDMPKLRRRLAAAAAASSGHRDTSSSATSLASSSKPEDCLRDLPFDMPKLRRRQLRPASAVEPLSSSSAHPDTTDSNNTDHGASGPVQRPPSLSLDLAGPSGTSGTSSRQFTLRPGGLSLNLGCSAFVPVGETVDQRLPLERQGWYHGAISRVEAEAELRLQQEGSYLVRNSESSRQDYSLSLKSARGFMHMRIQQDRDTGCYILGQFSKPFSSIPEMVHYYSVNRLPIRGAEHMCLLHPVIEQLL